MKPHRLVYCQSFLCRRKHDCDLFTGHLWKEVQKGTVDLEGHDKIVIEKYLDAFGNCDRFEQKKEFYDAEKKGRC